MELVIDNVHVHSPKLTCKDSRYSPNKMSRKTFRAFLNETFAFTDDIIMDRLFKHFNKISCDDIDTEEWVSGFSIFLKGYKIK